MQAFWATFALRRPKYKEDILFHTGDPERVQPSILWRRSKDSSNPDTTHRSSSSVLFPCHCQKRSPNAPDSARMRSSRENTMKASRRFHHHPGAILVIATVADPSQATCIMALRASCPICDHTSRSVVVSFAHFSTCRFSPSSISSVFRVSPI